MKIVFFTHYAELYGANRSLINLISGLKHLGHQAIVILPNKGKLSEALDYQQIENYIIPFPLSFTNKGMNQTLTTKRISDTIKSIPAITDICLRNNVDLIYSNSSVIDIGLIISKIISKPHIWHFREFGDLDYQLFPDIGEKIFRKLISHTDGIVFISEAVKNRYMNVKNNSVVIYNGVISRDDIKENVILWQSKRLKPIKNFIIVGLVRPSKGQDQVVYAFKEVIKKYPDVILNIVGGDQLNWINNIVQLNNLDNNVRVLGEVNNPFEYYLKSDVALMCSPNEAMGRVTLEAMASGVPVIGYNSGGTKELIINGFNGLLYNGTVKDLANKISYLIENPRKARELGLNGLNDINKNYTIENYSEQIHNYINEIADNYIKVKIPVNCIDSSGLGQYEKQLADIYNQLFICAPQKKPVENSLSKKISHSKKSFLQISVVTPSYNQGKFIEQTIQSVLDQNYPNFEHIIIDGGSTDETIEILKKYPHLKWISEKDNGQADALNKGFKKATGEIIAWINSDDWYEPNTFNAVSKFFEENQDKNVVMGNCNLVDKDGKIFDRVINFERGFNELKNYRTPRSIPTQPAVFFRRKLLSESGLIDVSLNYVMDYDLWMRFAKENRFYHINQIFANYRFHKDAKIGDENWEKIYPECEKVREKCDAEKNNPLVSVVIACYNYGMYLTEAVESVINQTYQNFEIIIVNDGSTDNSAEVANHLANKYILYSIKILNQNNSGQPAISRNNGIKASKGEYILCLDADDKIAPTFLQKCVSVLEGNPSISIAYTYRQDFDGVEQVVKTEEYKFNILKYRNIISVTSLFRKKSWEDVGGYRTNVKGLEDWDFWIALGAKGYFGQLIHEPLFYYRRHDTGLFQEAIKDQKRKVAQIIINNKGIYPTEIIKNAEIFLDQIGEETNFPRVSVIIPTYNRHKNLLFAIDSVLQQSFNDFEILVVNDAGEDVQNVITEFNDNRIKYFVHKSNKGLAAARNTGLKNAKGKYIAYLDDDDVYYPDHLKILLSFLENSNYKIAYTDAYRVIQEFKDGKYVTVNKDIPFSNDFSKEKLLNLNIAPVLCFMHEKSCLNNVGWFDETLKAHEDWEFWIRFSEKYEFYHIKKITSEFRQRTDKSNMTSSQSLDFYNSYRDIIAKHYNLSKDYKDILNNQVINLNIIKQRAINSGQIKNTDEPLHVSIIIPLYNKVELTQKCLLALYKNTSHDINFEVIVVDNASTDGTASYLEFAKRVFQNFSVIANTKNKGFAKANNKGVKQAKGKYVLFLNNDTEPTPGWLKKLYEIINNDCNVAAVGSKLLFPDGSLQHAGVAIIKDRQLPDPLVARHLYWKAPSNIADANKLKTYQALTAACLLVRKKVFDEVQGFDEEYWNGYEDVDLCFKFGELGYKLVYQPGSIVFHYESQSGPERFSKVSHNINRLHKKWIDRIKPDYILEKNGQEILTDTDKIKIYIPFERQVQGPLKNEKDVESFAASIIVLTYNGLQYTKEFIESIRKNTKSKYELLIIDNNSNDGTVEFLKKFVKNESSTRIFLNEKNLGFPKGINIGLKEAKGKFIIVVNNDIVVTNGWLERMIAIAESDPRIGLVGPVSNLVSGMQLDENSKYGTIEEMHNYAAKVKQKNEGVIFEFPRIAFLCTLIKKEVIEKIGGLDERFSPGNFEDDDYCLRAQKADFKTVIAKDVFIHHFGSKSFTADGLEKYKTTLETNQKIFIDKWGATPEEIWVGGKQTKGRKIMFTLNKNEFTENLERALSLIEEKEYDVALDYLNNSVELYDKFDHEDHDPDLANLLNLAGNVSLIKGNLETAKKYFEHALNEDKNSSHACTGLGEVLFTSKNYLAAKTMYEWGVKNNPENKVAIEGLSKVNKILNLSENDNSLFNSSEETDLPAQENENIESETDRLINEAYEMFSGKKFNESLDKLSQAEKIFNGQLSKPKNTEFAASFYNMKGFNYLGLNDIDNAKACFQKALEINPDSSQAYAGLGEILFLNEYNEQAKIMFEKAVQNNPNNLFAVDGLEKINRLLNDNGSPFDSKTQSNDKLKIYHRNDFGKLFNQLELYGKGAEVGVQAGLYSQTLRDTWEGEELYLIDWWKYSPNYKDIANVSDEKQKELYFSVINRFMDNQSVQIIRKNSIEASKQFPNEFFDWIYLDADHSYEGCTNDLEAWYPKLKKGGVFAGHDYIDGELIGGTFGVKSAVDNFISSKEVNLYLTEENTIRSWYFIKSGKNFAEDKLVSNEINENLNESDYSKLQSVLNKILGASYELFSLKHFDEAIDTLNKSEELFYSISDKELIAAFENMKGFNYLGLDDKRNARESFETALNINPESSQACAGLGELFYLDGKDKEAKTMYEFAVKNNPENQYALSGLEKVNKLLAYPYNHNTLLQLK